MLFFKSIGSLDSWFGLLCVFFGSCIISLKCWFFLYKIFVFFLSIVEVIYFCRLVMFSLYWLSFVFLGIMESVGSLVICLIWMLEVLFVFFKMFIILFFVNISCVRLLLKIFIFKLVCIFDISLLNFIWIGWVNL